VCDDLHVILKPPTDEPIGCEGECLYRYFSCSNIFFGGIFYHLSLSVRTRTFNHHSFLQGLCHQGFS